MWGMYIRAVVLGDKIMVGTCAEELHHAPLITSSQDHLQFTTAACADTTLECIMPQCYAERCSITVRI
jgi:acyl-CoA hydrolase